MKYRKKPVEIEAIQYKGVVNLVEILEFVGEHGYYSEVGPGNSYKEHVKIPTLEGTMEAIPGDWIIKGIKGEFYPCKPDIFEGSYEAVE